LWCCSGCSRAVITSPTRTDPGVLAAFWATLTVGDPGTPVTFDIARSARGNGCSVADLGVHPQRGLAVLFLTATTSGTIRMTCKNKQAL
jgi:hypothetical protein